VLKLRELVQQGALGRLQYIYSNRLNLGKIRREENILWSFAPHDVSVILGLLGEEPERVDGQGGNFLHSHIADVTVSLLSFASGVRAHIFVSWLHPYKEQKLVIVGERQMAVFDDTQPKDKLVLYPHSIEWKDQVPVANKAQGTPVAIDGTEPLRAECAHYLECIATGATPRTDGAEGVRVLRVLQQCQEALETGKPVTPKPAAPPPPPAPAYFVHPSAFVDQPCEIGAGTKIWHFCHVQKGAKLGRNCILGQNVNIANDVQIGHNVKIQNNVSVYTGTVVEDDVFLGPSCVMTNVTNPRAQVSRHSLYEVTVLRRGCTIGANATLVCGVEIGRYAFIGAGAVVAKSVPDYALVMGVPARQVGWVSRHGLPLKAADADGIYTCPESKLRYRETSPGVLRCLDVDEEAPLPEALRTGKVYYDDLVHGSHLTLPPATTR
jgi:UDP-2-acetamido-3-amino-2,3-dideoxy-glucuronate N-acetyltransferase